MRICIYMPLEYYRELYGILLYHVRSKGIDTKRLEDPKCFIEFCYFVNEIVS